jgi:hypothetical protein
MAEVTEITVSSGRTLPHPTVNYATLRADISVRFIINDDENHEEVTTRMQNWADEISRKHINRMIREAKAAI